MQTNYNVAPQTEENPFDFKKWVFKLLKFWPFFLLSILIALTAAYFYNSILTPRFKVKTTLLVKKNFIVDKDFVDLNLPSGFKGLENEIGILKSYSMAEATLKQLDFGVTYYQTKGFKDKEIFKNIPFKVSVDSLHPQLSNTFFNVKILNENEFQIESDLENAFPIIPLTQEGVPVSKVFFPSGKYSFGEIIKNEVISFKIEKQRKNLKAGAFSFKLNQLESLANSFSSILEVKPTTKTSSILQLSIEVETPEKGAEYLNKLVENYINSGLEEKNMTAKNAIEFINRQLYGIADSLSFVENKLQKFRTDNQIFDLSAEGNAVFSNLTTLTNQQSMEDLKLKYYQYLLDYIRKEINFKDVVAPSVMGISDPLLNNLVINLSELYSELNTLKLSAKEKNPAYSEVQSKIQMATKSLEENLINIINSAKIVSDDINGRIKKAEREISKLPGTERQLVNIKRRFSLNEHLYTYLLQKRAEAGIAKASNIPDNQVIDVARQALLVYPKKSTNYIIAGIVGFLIPLGFILLKDYFNERIQDKNELQKNTQIPIVGEILHNSIASNLVVSTHPKSAVAESIRSLRSTVLYLTRSKEKRTIMITSSTMGEGKSFCSTNLAYCLGAVRKKTLLMEVDFRRPSMDNNLNGETKIGLTDYLNDSVDKSQIIQKTAWEYIDVIAAGGSVTNPMEIFMNRELAKLFLDLQNEYEYIILDTAPVGLVTDALELAGFADITLCIVRENHTRYDSLNRIHELQQLGSLRNVYFIYNDVIKKGTSNYFEEDKKMSFLKRNKKLIS